jgi:hypothetical protein
MTDTEWPPLSNNIHDTAVRQEENAPQDHQNEQDTPICATGNPMYGSGATGAPELDRDWHEPEKETQNRKE